MRPSRCLEAPIKSGAILVNSFLEITLRSGKSKVNAGADLSFESIKSFLDFVLRKMRAKIEGVFEETQIVTLNKEPEFDINLQ